MDAKKINYYFDLYNVLLPAGTRMKCLNDNTNVIALVYNHPTTTI